MNEPSVLDYLKSKLMPWRGERIEIPPMPAVEKALPKAGEESTGAEDLQMMEAAQAVKDEPQELGDARSGADGILQVESSPASEFVQRVSSEASSETGAGLASAQALAPARMRLTSPAAAALVKSEPIVWPWRSLGALVLALFAQLALEPGIRNGTMGVIIYAGAAILLFWAIRSKEWVLEALAEDAATPLSVNIRWIFMLPVIPLLLISFLAFGGNTFTPENLAIWAVLIVYVMIILWQPANRSLGSFWREKAWPWIKNPSINLRITPWVLLVLLGVALVLFFRLYRLDQVPGEMFSDHAEKLLDVGDILNGKYSIFFPRNTGRELDQMYLSAAISLIFGTGLSFMTLKIGTALCGLLTLPFVYLLGKEIGGKWVGFLSFLLVGIGYWPNLIARIGLRFPLYPLFAAPALYYLIRGLRYQKRNDFILSGIFLGIGLHGYSPYRIVPVVFLILIGFYLLHNQAKGKRSQTITAFFILAFVSLVIFLPLARYAQENPDMFNLRALSRLGTTEQPLPAPAWQVFVENTWKAWIMPFWHNGDIWVHSVTNRPALDVVTAALYFLGSLQVLVRYLRKRHWIDLFLLLSVPLLMLPSILSLAFPGENPSLNRTGAAYIPIFIIAAIALEGILSGFRRLSKGRGAMVAAGIIGVILVGWSAANNNNLVQVKFDQQFMAGAWNTDQIGRVIRGFVDSIGSEDNAFVIPFPYWVDTRLVGINAGFPDKDYALNRDQLETTLPNPAVKLFIFKTEDIETLAALQKLYPDGKAEVYSSIYQGKDFESYLVPAATDQLGQHP